MGWPPAAISTATICCMPRVPICCGARDLGRKGRRATRAHWRWSPMTASAGFSSGGCAKFSRRQRGPRRRPNDHGRELYSNLWPRSSSELGGQRGGNLDGGMVGNQRHFFVPLNTQANADRVARSLDERRLDGHFLQYLVHVAATCLSSVRQMPTSVSSTM